MTTAATDLNGTDRREHVPVMVAEVVELLSVPHPRVVIDATLGTGGHAAAILDANPDATLIGLDRDVDAIEAARQRLESFADRIKLVHSDFAEIESAARSAGHDNADAILADLGMSSFALDDPSRGFSFRTDGPLDMRMDRSSPVRAYDIVNEETEAELARIIYEYGEERMSRRIARMIVEARRRAPIETTGALRAIIERAVGGRRTGIHPATRTFQALRIAVNREMESLAALLERAPRMLNPGGRLAVISYHSLEDRAVKETFRALAHSGEFHMVSAKVIKPSAREIAHNPRARSARIRCLEREGGKAS